MLALLLVRYIDAGPILKWAYNVLDLKSCIDDAVARESLNVLHKPCKDIGARSKEFETFVRGTTIGEREAAARALCLFDGVGRTDIKIDEQHIKDYLTYLFSTKSPLPGACHDGRNTQNAKPLRYGWSRLFISTSARRGKRFTRVSPMKLLMRARVLKKQH